ncbi:MAG TPA: protease complex subunit PrcB family protein [Natronincola sp.]|nr:protease complex subunit PrcB family protein [Natronincola sp.]
MPQSKTIFLFLVLFLIICTSVEGASNRKVFLNEKDMPLEYPVMFKLGRNLISLKDIAAILKLNIRQEENDVILLEKGPTWLRLTPGSTTVAVNGENKVLAIAPQIISKTVYVPIRFVAETFGFEVKWNEQKMAILLSPDPTFKPSAEYSIVNRTELQQTHNLHSWYDQNHKIRGIYSMELDLDTYVLICVGMKPTGGYSVQIDRAFLLEEDYLYIIAEIIEPKPTDLVTMALTYPHVLLKFSNQTFSAIDGTIVR